VTGLGPLRKKLELLSRVYEMTNEAVFTGDENEAQAYVDLMEKREIYFTQIKILDEEISDEVRGTEALGVLDDIKRLTGKIVALDRANAAAASRIMDGLKKSLKGINENRNVSKKYNDFITASDGMYFDQKN